MNFKTALCCVINYSPKYPLDSRCNELNNILRGYHLVLQPSRYKQPTDNLKQTNRYDIKAQVNVL